ncbi:MAG: sodium:solute symporter family transporter [Bacteroidota bacterium]
MNNIIDSLIVLVYFVIIFILGFYFSRKNSKSTSDEFLTGGRHMKWWQTGLTLIAMFVDPGIMGTAALSFIYGFYVIQWNGVNFWISGWFSSLFFVAIYWRSKIVTTPEYLEKRFNVITRAFFSVVMISTIIAFLAYAVYLGGLLLEELLGWPFWVNVFLIAAIAGFYVMYGGLKTMLTMDVMQAVFLLITIFVMGITSFILLGGFEGIKALDFKGLAGNEFNSLLPPVDFNIKTDAFFPLPAVLTYAIIASLSWIVCNFSMAQRILASKNEAHAQKALLMAGIFNAILMFMAYLVGGAMRLKMPDILPDKAFIIMMFEYFPVGIRGILIAGIMAALLSTVDGLLSSSSSLFAQDIYFRFFRKNITEKQAKKSIRIIEAFVILLIFVFVPLFLGAQSAMEMVQGFLGNVMGVIIAIFVLGIFFKRTTSWAAFGSMLFGLVLAFTLDWTTDINFAFIGTLSFVITVLLGYIFSYFERPKTSQQLNNLTIWTLKDVKGPFVGLKSWPNLWKWAIALPIIWVAINWVWNWYMTN